MSGLFSFFKPIFEFGYFFFEKISSTLSNPNYNNNKLFQTIFNVSENQTKFIDRN